MRALARKDRRTDRWLPPMALVALLVACWQGWVMWHHTPAYELPSPGRVARAVPATLALLPGHVASTTGEALLGLVLGAVSGAALAVLVSASRLARRVVYPLLIVSQTVPPIVLAPLLVLFFGYGITAKVVVVALIVFFPVVVATVQGLDDADAEMVDLVRSMGGPPATVFRTVRLPAAVPAFFAGLRIGAAYAVTGAVIGEYVGARSGLGVFIDRAKKSYQLDRIMVAVGVIAVLSIALFGAVVLLSRLATPWNRPRRRSREGAGTLHARDSGDAHHSRDAHHTLETVETHEVLVP